MKKLTKAQRHDAYIGAMERLESYNSFVCNTLAEELGFKKGDLSYINIPTLFPELWEMRNDEVTKQIFLCSNQLWSGDEHSLETKRMCLLFAAELCR